jgi:hypothetical protein
MRFTITSDEFPDLPDDTVALYVTGTGWPVYCVPRGSTGTSPVIPHFVFHCTGCSGESSAYPFAKTANDANHHAANCRGVPIGRPTDADPRPER